MLGIVITILFSALFYAFWALGTVVVTRGKHARQRELAAVGYFGARNAKNILSDARRYLLVCQIWRFFSAFLTGFFTFRLINYFLLPSFERTYGPYGSQLLVALVLLLVWLASLIFVQFAKALAYTRPTRTLCLASFPMIFFGRLVQPLVWLLGVLIDRLLARGGFVPPGDRELAVSTDELQEIIERSCKAGELEEDEKQMIHHVLAFSDTLVREVMTPRADIIAVAENASLAEVKTILEHEKVSRVLVTGTNLDDVKGVVLAKDLLRFVGESGAKFSLRELIRPAFFVSNSKHVDELLREFRHEATHYAVVFDEHGGVDGVVTAEDLVEEIVGEIFDEYDSPVEEIDVIRTSSGDLVVDGSMIIDDLNAQYRLGIPRGEYDTIAGFVIKLLGRIPLPGEIAGYHNLQLKVENVENNRITQVRIRQIIPS